MMVEYPVTRTPEQGHTAPCLAKALIVAIENYRDMLLVDSSLAVLDNRPDLEGTVVPFRLAAQDNAFLAWADGYLACGITECICEGE